MGMCPGCAATRSIQARRAGDAARATPPARAARPGGAPGVAGVGGGFGRLRRDAVYPGAQGGVSGEVEAALVGDVGVGVEGDVRHRVAPPDKEVVPDEMPLRDAERIVAELALGRQGEPALLGHLDAVRRPETRRRDVRLVAVLLDVLSVFAEFEGLTSSNPPNAPLISARPSA